MKIGIITFHHALNYGAVLQTYALQQYLNDLGIENDIIDYRSPYIEYFYKPIKSNFIKDTKMFLREVIYYPNNKKKRREFDSFLKKYIKLSRIVRNKQDLERLNPEYDFFLAGSDQVWNLKWSGLDKAYFLDFTDKSKKYSYAASFGFEKIPDGQEQVYRELLEGFQSISVRENTGKEIVKGLLGREAEVSVDPTCLLDKEKWEKICIYPKEKDYVLVYMLDHSDELLQFAKQFAKNKNISIIYISDALKKKNDFIYKGFLSPSEFVGLFANAEYVVTNSFHGLMFSVIFEKKFCIQYQKKINAPNSRLYDFLYDYNLEDRLLENIKMDEEIDYLSVKKIMAKKVEQSKKYILKIKKNEKIQIYHSQEECCGCRACEQICPVDAITMEADNEGFIYPKIDNKKCIRCKKCVSVCPTYGSINNNKAKNTQVNTAVAYQKDSVKRMKSRSGGVFVAVSDVVLRNDGVVYGVAFDDNLEVRHMRATSFEKRDTFCGSKYVQSDTSSTFFQVYTDLRDGKKVLFSGTSCQIAGLYSYLKRKGASKECVNLITIDIVCHGVVSPRVWQDNLKDISKILGSKPISANFRDKTFGWSSHIESYSTENNKITSEKYTDIFYENVCLRPCCYKCPYTSLVRISDITLADAWGIRKIEPEWDYEKGVSLVLINTEKGNEYFNEASKDLVRKNVSIESFMQPNLYQPSERPQNRDKIMNIYTSKGYEYLAKWCMKQRRKDKKKNKLKAKVVKILRILHIK